MNRIRILKEEVANQIAAGEVVERPASVVRELLDNSLDAGATQINVTIENGGKRLIRVSDNGLGMDRDDLLLSLERHATSKITTIDDLHSIQTLGFRGEAIPSIASVSRLQISSRPKEQLSGHCLKSEGGKITSIEETGAPVGTTVEVRDLFFNLPARRKFLRADKTETDHIVDAVSRIALPFNGVLLKLESSQRTILNLPNSEDKLSRLITLLGLKIVQSLIEVVNQEGPYRLMAYIAPPEFDRNRGDRLYIYINGRNIRDRLIMRAVMEGYGQRLMKGRYPQAAIFIEVDSELVDINVHPTKQEVRLHESRFLYHSLVTSINTALGNQFQSFTQPAEKGPFFDFKSPAKAPSISETEWDYLKEERPQKEIRLNLKKEEDQTFISPSPHVLGQLGQNYILCENESGLLMIDQHAAHERIIYERLERSFKERKIESQSFLIPYRMELSVQEGRKLEEKLESLSDLGLEIEHFGGQTFLLRSVPSMLVDVKWDEFLRELISVLEQGNDIFQEKVLGKILTVMACHGSIRAGMKMTHLEMEKLVEQLESLNLPTHCPHGRPIFKVFTLQEIARMFRRII